LENKINFEPTLFKVTEPSATVSESFLLSATVSFLLTLKLAGKLNRVSESDPFKLHCKLPVSIHKSETLLLARAQPEAPLLLARDPGPGSFKVSYTSFSPRVH